MQLVDTEHLGNQRVIGAWEHEGVLVDPGPEPTIPNVLAGLGEDWEPRAILLTHIHLDHAAGTGALVRRWPDTPVYVHERGAPHVIDPERLLRSATRLYGEEHMGRLWGEVVPVPEGNVHALSGGETVLDDYRVAYTPGHANHHVSYLHEPTGTAFCGDAAGIRVMPADYVFAPTPPPEVDPPAWRESLDRIEEWGPTALAITHFGAVEDGIADHLQTVRESLQDIEERVGRLTLEEFVANHIAILEERLDLTTAEMFQRAAPPDQLWLGMNRYLT